MSMQNRYKRFECGVKNCVFRLDCEHETQHSFLNCFFNEIEVNNTHSCYSVFQLKTLEYIIKKQVDRKHENRTFLSRK